MAEDINLKQEEQEAEVPTVMSEDEQAFYENDENRETIFDIIDDLTAQRDDYKDKYLRQVAELDNYKKRNTKDIKLMLHNTKCNVLTNVLNIVDDFENAIKMNKTNEDIESIKTGFDMIYNKFINTLNSLDVKKIETDGADFTTDYHEAVVMFDGTEEQHNKVIDCVQTGYMLGDTVLRHAKVVVGK